jgi:small subunit ribosomal protein S9
MAQRDQITAVGRRKTAVARVLLQPGNGQITVNGRPLQVHLPRATLQYIATQPFRAVGGARFSVLAKCNGGGITGDPRAKERKKPGLKRARKAPQYTKR